MCHTYIWQWSPGPSIGLRSSLVDDSVSAVLCMWCGVLAISSLLLLLLLLCHHLLLLLLGLLGNDLTRQQLRLFATHRHVSTVVSNLTVAHRAELASIVEALRAVIGVAKVLLEILWWLIVTVGCIIQLHVGLLLTRHTAAGLKWDI